MTLRASAVLIHDVMACAVSELRMRGYRKRTEQILTLDISDDLLGWVGLNRAVNRGDGQLEINPFIGVRHQTMGRKLAEIRGQEFRPYIPPTVRVHPQYLMPEGAYDHWLFSEQMPIEARVAEMVEDINGFGRAYVGEHTRLETLAKSTERGKYGDPESRAFRLPVIYLLMGDQEIASATLEGCLSNLGDRADMAAKQYREYAEAMREALGQSPLT